MVPEDSSTTTRPSGRLRLAAALGGAGVLAAGLGAGVVQTVAQEQPAGATAGEEALGTAQPTTTTAAPAESTSTSTSTTSSTSSGATSTPTAVPAPPSEPAATETAPEQPGASAATAAAPTAEVPGAGSDADEASVETPAPAAETPAEDKPADKKKQAPKSDGDDRDAGYAKPKARKQPKADKPEPKKHEHEHDHGGERRAPAAPVMHAPSGVPTVQNPTTSIATPGAAPIGVPNFFIDKFRIPPFLLPIYQAAGIEYGVRWEILAAINEIETDYGRNLNVSSAGALGWMQFMPATWKAYGVDANGDRRGAHRRGAGRR